MDFGRPDNARLINRLKVLSALRNNSDMSCAELSRLLLINKVSIGEIVKKLMEEGLVEETGKIVPPSGRPATRIDIAWNRGSVLAVEVKERKIVVAQCSLRGKIMRIESFGMGQDDDETRTRFMSSILRMSRSSEISIHGGVIASEDDLSWLGRDLVFPLMSASPIECVTAAENARAGNALYNTVFIDLGEHVSASYYDGTVRLLPDFRHLKVSNGRACSCGRTGCLDTVISLSSIREDYGEEEAMDPFGDPAVSARIRQALDPLSFAIAEAMKVLGADKAMITGPLSEMPDGYYSLLNEKTKSLLPEGRSPVVYKSIAGRSGTLEGAAVLALDEYFFRTPLILKLEELEAF